MLHYSVVRGFTLGDYLDNVMVMVVVTGVLPSPPPPEQQSPTIISWQDTVVVNSCLRLFAVRCVFVSDLHDVLVLIVMFAWTG